MLEANAHSWCPLQDAYSDVSTRIIDAPHFSYHATQSEHYATAYSEEDTDEGLQYDSPEAPSLSLGSTNSISSVEPQSTIESEDQLDTSSISESDASTINRPVPSQLALDQSESSLHFTMSELPSIRSELSTTSPTRLRQQPPRRRAPMVTSARRSGAQCPSSLSLDVELVGLPEVSNNGRGIFLDGESDSSMHYYGVDLSCLSQPDGTNAWTLSLGATSPFPSISTSDDTPQSGFSPTFSSPDGSTTTHEPESTESDFGCSPSLSVDYHRLESPAPTPAYRCGERQVESGDDYTDSYGEPSPPYEAESLILEPIPYHQPMPQLVPEEPRSHFKEVLGDMKRFGNKLKNIFRTKPQLASKGKAPATVEAVTYHEPESGVDYHEYPSTSNMTSVQTILNRRGDYALRTPPGLLVCIVKRFSVIVVTDASLQGYVQEVEEEGEEENPVVEQETTPRLSENRRKLLKPQTTAEIKHIRRRTLPAAPLSNDWPSSSYEAAAPIINVSHRRPRPRSLVFTTTAGSNPTLDTTYTSGSSARSPLHHEAPLPSPLRDVAEPAQVDETAAAARRRKRWSTPFSLFSRS